MNYIKLYFSSNYFIDIVKYKNVNDINGILCLLANVQRCKKRNIIY